MSAPATQAPRGRRRPLPMRATVARTQAVGANFVRVTLAGPELERFNFPGPASHFKLVLAANGGAPTLPTPGADGLVSFDPGAPLVLRTYTARAFRPESLELDIDMFLHGDGPASTWARQAQVGDSVAVTSPRASGFQPASGAEWILLGADSSAIPALATILDAQPDRRLNAVVEVDDLRDAQALPASARDGVQFVVRESGQRSGTALLAALSAHSMPDGVGFIWVAAEASIIRAARAHLGAGEAGPRDALVTRGYWRAGEINHPDHDDGREPIG
jgi:NADPH-dependent ferric siderophore reductase